jgi:hypothetical protein
MACARALHIRGVCASHETWKLMAMPHGIWVLWFASVTWHMGGLHSGTSMLIAPPVSYDVDGTCWLGLR